MAYHHTVRSEHHLSTLCLSLGDPKIEGKSVELAFEWRELRVSCFFLMSFCWDGDNKMGIYR